MPRDTHTTFDHTGTPHSPGLTGPRRTGGKPDEPHKTSKREKLAQLRNGFPIGRG